MTAWMLALALGATPDEAIVAAARDAQSVSSSIRGTRWIWCPKPDLRTQRLSVVTLNNNVAELKLGSVHRPLEIDRGILLRVNLYDYAPTEFNRVRAAWDKLADPYLYEQAKAKADVATGFQPYDVMTRVAAKHMEAREYSLHTIGTIPSGTRLTVLREDKAKDNREWLLCEHAGRKAWVAKEDATRIVGPPVVHAAARKVQFGRWLGEAAVLGDELQKLTDCDVPIVSAGELIRQAWLSNDDGLYYVFADVPDDYDTFLGKVGLNRKAIADLGSDRWAALFRSGVTDVPRQLVFSPTLIMPLDRPGGHSESRDVGKNAADAKDARRHAVRNLLDANVRAGETFTSRPNGGIIFGLWAFDAAGKGTRQAEVPPDIAYDSTVRAPFDQRLVAGRSCVTCHCLGKDAGWKPFRNVVYDLVPKGADIVDDLSVKNGQRDALAALARKYKWTQDRALELSRQTFTEFCGACGGATYTPEQFGKDLGEFWVEYWWSGVTAEVACRELGLTDAKARALLSRNQKKPAANQAIDWPRALQLSLPPRLIEISPGFVAEDAVIAGLKAGLTVIRRDWEQVFGEAWERSRTGLAIP